MRNIQVSNCCCLSVTLRTYSSSGLGKKFQSQPTFENQAGQIEIKEGRGVHRVNPGNHCFKKCTPRTKLSTWYIAADYMAWPTLYRRAAIWALPGRLHREMHGDYWQQQLQLHYYSFVLPWYLWRCYVTTRMVHAICHYISYATECLWINLEPFGGSHRG